MSLDFDGLKNIFSDLPKVRLDNEFIEVLLQNNAIKIERIVSTGQITSEDAWYDQVYDEWVILLKGHASVEIENAKEVHLSPGDYLFIKAHQRHRVSWTHPNEVCVWLAVHITHE